MNRGRVKDTDSHLVGSLSEGGEGTAQNRGTCSDSVNDNVTFDFVYAHSLTHTSTCHRLLAATTSPLWGSAIDGHPAYFALEQEIVYRGKCKWGGSSLRKDPQVIPKVGVITTERVDPLVQYGPTMAIISKRRSVSSSRMAGGSALVGWWTVHAPRGGHP